MHEEALLETWKKRLVDAYGQYRVFKDALVVRSVIDDIGLTAQSEWSRLDKSEVRRIDESRMKGRQPQPFKPSPFELCVIGLKIACDFSSNLEPSESELRYRLILIEDDREC